MATKLDRAPKTGKRVPDGKRVTFDHGQAKADGGKTQIKTGDVKKG